MNSSSLYTKNTRAVQVQDKFGGFVEFKIDNPSFTVAQLKQHIQEKMGISPEYQTLSINNKDLKDEMFLSEVDQASSTSAASESGVLSTLSSWLWTSSSTEYDDDNQVNAQDVYDSMTGDDLLKVELNYAPKLNGGCDEGAECCSCCGFFCVCRCSECLFRVCCFYSGCDLHDMNSCQWFCWRCYFCANHEQQDRALGAHH